MTRLTRWSTILAEIIVGLIVAGILVGVGLPLLWLVVRPNSLVTRLFALVVTVAIVGGILTRKGSVLRHKRE